MDHYADTRGDNFDTAACYKKRGSIFGKNFWRGLCELQEAGEEMDLGKVAGGRWRVEARR